MDMQTERITGVLGKDRARSPKNTLCYLKFLQKKIQGPCLLSGIEEFEWERSYLAEGWDSADYQKMKAQKPSFMDQFDLQELVPPATGADDIVACVKRVIDQKEFKVPLSQLECIDFNEECYQFIDDYVAWYTNY